MAEKQKFGNIESQQMSAEIILITHEFPPYRGGAGVYCRELAVAAIQLGIKIRLWCPRGSAPPDNLPFEELPWSGSQSWRSSYLLIRKLKGELEKRDRYAIFHIAEPGVCRALIRFGWLMPKNSRFLLTIHGSELLRFTRNPLERFLFRKLLQRSEAIHVLSKFNFSACIRLCQTCENKLKLIPGAPSGAVVGKSPASLDQALAKNGTHLLCVGRIHPRKGQAELIRALNQLEAKTQATLTLRVVGPVKSHKYFSQLNDLANKFGGKIEFLGNLSDEELRGLYQKSDIFCLTPVSQSKSVEGFGFVFLEASAHGLPVVATRTGGVEDAVIHGQTGLLSDPGNIDRLIDNLRTLIENREMRRKLGEGGLRWSARHSWLKIAAELYR